MNIKPICNDQDLASAFRQLEVVFQAPVDTRESDEREILVTLIEAYENAHYAIAPPDPIVWRQAF